MEQRKQIQLGTMMLRVQFLASLSELRIWRCCELWRRPVAVAPIRPLAWEPPHAVGVALEKTERQKRNYFQNSSYIFMPELIGSDSHKIIITRTVSR